MPFHHRALVLWVALHFCSGCTAPLEGMRLSDADRAMLDLLGTQPPAALKKSQAAPKPSLESKMGVAAVEQSRATPEPIKENGPDNDDYARNPLRSSKQVLEESNSGVVTDDPATAPSSAGPAPAPIMQAEELPLGQPNDDSKIDLHLDDVEIRKALEVISREAPCNVLISDEVKGKVTAHLEKVTCEQALAAILKLGGLVAQGEGNLLYVYTLAEAQAAKDKTRQVATKVYHLRYIRGTDIERIIMPFLSQGVSRISITPASDVGIAGNSADVGGNSMAGGEALIIQDYDSVLRMVDGIVAQLDVQPKQVLIEAVILEVTHDNARNLGVNFAVLDGVQHAMAVSGSAVALNAAGGVSPGRTVTSAGQIVGNTNGYLAENSGMKFGYIGENAAVFVHALESCGRTRILASPRILVLNKQRAELIIGDKIGYKTLSITESSSVEQVQFINVGTQLRLRPFIVDDGLIRLEVHPERSSGHIQDGIPQTTTSEVTTNVMIPDGSTIVIGGLMQDEMQFHEEGIPGLKDIPWAGFLFRKRTKSLTKKELVVLLTPRSFEPGIPDIYPLPNLTRAESTK